MINMISPSGIVNKTVVFAKSVKPLAHFTFMHLCELIGWHHSSLQFFPRFVGLDNYTPLKSEFPSTLCLGSA